MHAQTITPPLLSTSGDQSLGSVGMTLVDCFTERCTDTPKSCCINVSTSFDKYLHYFSVTRRCRQVQWRTAKKYIFCVNISISRDER